MKIKSALKLFSVLAASALPTAAVAESFGLALPAALDLPHLFTAFVVTLVAAIAFSDYARQPLSLPRTSSSSATLRLVAQRKYVYPLAA